MYKDLSKHNGFASSQSVTRAAPTGDSVLVWVSFFPHASYLSRWFAAVVSSVFAGPPVEQVEKLCPDATASLRHLGDFEEASSIGVRLAAVAADP